MTNVTLQKSRRRRVWLLRWYGTDGRRYCETIGDARQMAKRDAEAVRRGKQSKLDCGVVKPDRPRRNTLADFLRQDREAVSIDSAPRTIVEMQTAAKHAAAALGDDFDLHKVNAAAVGRIKKHLSDKGLAPATIGKVNTHLQGAFSRGMGQDPQLVTSNPFLPRTKRRPNGVRLPKVHRKPIEFYRGFESRGLAHSHREDDLVVDLHPARLHQRPSAGRDAQPPLDRPGLRRRDGDGPGEKRRDVRGRRPGLPDPPLVLEDLRVPHGPAAARVRWTPCGPSGRFRSRPGRPTSS